MSTQSRALAILSYVLPLAGPLAGLGARRDDGFVRHHAAQGLAIDAGTIAAPLLWALLAWVAAWLPTAGAVIGVVLFGLVLATEAILLAGRALGVAHVLRGQLGVAPLVGGIAERAAFAGEPDAGPLSPVSPPVLEAAAEQQPAGEPSSTNPIP